MKELEAIYREHYPYVRKVCYRMMHAEADAEDLAQQVFLLLASTPKGKSKPRYTQFAGRAKLRTWLHAVAARACLMELRQRRKRPLPLSLDALVEVGEEAVPKHWETSAPWADPDARLMVEEVLSRVAPGYRAVLWLRYFAGMDHRESSQALGYSVGCSKSQTYRGLQRLRTELSAE